MKRPSERINFLLQQQEFFIFLGLLFWLAIIDTLQQSISSWEHYFRTLAVLIFLQIPVLVFVWRRVDYKKYAGKKKYRIGWIICFLVFLPGTVLLCIFWQPLKVSQELLVSGGLGCLLLELLLIANGYLRKQFQNIGLLARIGLEGWVFVVICLTVGILSAMAVSSMGIPEYDSKGRLLIGYEFSLTKVIKGFRDFLIIFFQLLLIYLCGYLLFFINSRFLVAKVFRQKGLIIYCLSALSVISILYPFLGQFLIFLSRGPLLSGTFSDNPFSWENAFAAVSIVFLTLPVLLSLQWARQNSQIVELEKAKTRTELDLLRQQLNPHFFFNTLNNLYALSLQQSPETPESILRLSELMRYVIYKGRQPMVRLAEEVKYMTDYMQLQQIRLKKDLDLQFEIGKIENEQILAPLLLIVFVENAFKHGIEPAEDAAFLHLKMKCENKRLYFSCENSLEPQVPKEGGIGLSNLKRRLVLLYPDKHRLETFVKNNTFTAVLELDLS